MTRRNIKLAYGRNGLHLNVPDDALIVEPKFIPGLADEATELRTALRRPIDSPAINELVTAGQKVVIVHTDITRATPNDRILPVLIEELESAGIMAADITLLNALGTHRKQTDQELRQMLGPRVVDNYCCLQHDAFDDNHLVKLGTTRLGHPVRINKTFFEADVKILTGFIEPHFFAGFSAGPKGVLPSIAGFESVLTNHGADMIAHADAVWGVTKGNPIWEEMLEAARMADPTFILNVSLNRDRKIIGIFAGSMEAAHAKGCHFVKDVSMAPVDEPFDVVIATNAGYPLDQNLYQSVKGMSAAARVVRKGGMIIIAAECSDGIPDHGSYAQLLHESDSPAHLLKRVETPGFSCQDQWQVQIQARIQQHADVYVFADGLTDQQIRDALLTPTRDIEKTLADLSTAASRPPSVCVLPEGPVTIPYLT